MAISSISERRSLQILDFRIGKLESRARHLLPELCEIGGNFLRTGRIKTRARLHSPLLGEILRIRHVGGPKWRDQFVNGFPTLG